MRSISSAPPATAPATMSAWPFRYLVALWIERSKPASMGRKLMGLAKVLSMMDTDRKSTRLNSSHSQISYAVFCLKKKKAQTRRARPQDRGQEGGRGAAARGGGGRLLPDYFGHESSYVDACARIGLDSKSPHFCHA